MITNFNEYFEKWRKNNWERFDLSVEEQNNLKLIVSKWDDNDLEPAKNVLSDYFKVIVPNEILIEIFQENLNIALENSNGGISDTCQRDILIDLLVKKLGLHHWPLYGDGDKFYNNFIKEFKVAIVAIGGRIDWW